MEADTEGRRKDVWTGALFLVMGALIVLYAFTAMRNGVPIVLWGPGWVLGPLFVMIGGKGLWSSQRSGKSD